MTTVAEREVLRLHIRSTIRDDAAHGRATVWCLENSYSGLGWGIWDHEGLAGISWSEYEEHGRANSNVRRFHDAAVGTLLWTRQRNGNYWLGVVEGEWEYRDEQQARDLDLFNVRPTRWEQVGTEGKVPGRVVNAFRSRWTLQKIHDDAAREYTRRLHEKLFEGRSDFEPADAETVIKSLLGPEDLEGPRRGLSAGPLCLSGRQPTAIHARLRVRATHSRWRRYRRRLGQVGRDTCRPRPAALGHGRRLLRLRGLREVRWTATRPVHRDQDR